MRNMCFALVLWVSFFCGLLEAKELSSPRGVILVMVDDVGWGDFNALTPGNVQTPNLDTLHHEGVRLTDFHVGTTCSPTRASLLTGRRVNATGVWHTVAGRSLLRENEQTIAEVFQANGWRTGIFGKWHLGDSYPYLPRYRGFDIEVIHGNGAVGEGPDYWGNNYYSTVDYHGNPTTADIYYVNGKPVKADKFCTDFWFDRACRFIGESVKDKKPFFCYIPTNAAHGPFNAPHGGIEGFYGLVENIDKNMGRLDQFLASEGIKDDVLLIFTSDNGTSGGSSGGFKGKKGSPYEGGHHVPCFWRWNNGGIGGSKASAKDIDSLTAVMDLFPTFMDLCRLKKPAGGQPMHGISLKKMLLDPDYVPTGRTVVVDTQRDAYLEKWKKACVMQDEVSQGKIIHKWRLVKNKEKAELFDILTDRGQDRDLIDDDKIPDGLIDALTQKYEMWWTDISQNSKPFPPFVINPDKILESTLYAHDWMGQRSSPWSQGRIRKGAEGTRTHSIRFDKTARYRFELRRWPREDSGAIDGDCNKGHGKILPVKKARLILEGTGEMTQDITPGDAMAVFEMDITAGKATTLETAFMDENDNILSGAYYVYIRPAEHTGERQVSEQARKRPNFLFIIVDDQSPFDLKTYNPASELNAPNIDGLAAEGVVFDGAYHMGAWTGAVCTPSRHMVMSGRTVWRIPGHWHQKVGDEYTPQIPPDLADFAMAAVFNRAGYDTMRTCKKGNSFRAANEKFTILHEAAKRGGTDETGSAWHAEQVLNYLNDRQASNDEDPFLIYFGFSHPHDKRDGKPELLKKYGAVNHKDENTLPKLHPDQPALPVNYLPEHPFHHGHPECRDEVRVSGVWRNRDEATIRNELGREFACSENIDIQIGRVLSKLDEMGELENTIIFYTSDHGIAIGRHGLQGKQNLYEHTWRVPYIVKGPGIKAGVRAPGNIYLLDTLATLCDLASIELPETNDGISFKPVLEGKKQAVRDVLYGVYCGGTKPGMRSVRKGDWKLIKYDVMDGSVRQTQLFNLAQNPNEWLVEHHDPAVIALTGIRPKWHQVNLADDPRYAEKLAEMEALLLSEMERLGDPHRLWNQPK